MKKLLFTLLLVATSLMGFTQKVQKFALDHNLMVMAFEQSSGEALLWYGNNVKTTVMMKSQTYFFEALISVDGNGVATLKSISNTKASEGLQTISTDKYEGVFKTNLSKGQWEELVGAAKTEAENLIESYNK